MSSWGKRPGARAFTRTPSRRPLDGQGLGQVPHPGLGRRGVGHARSAGERLGGQDVADGPGLPAASAHRRWSSWLQKNVPSSTMRLTARQALGRMSSARTGKLAAALLTSTRTGPSAPSSCVEGGRHLLGLADVGAGVGRPAADRLDRGHPGQPVLLGARDDPHRRPRPGQLDGDGPAQAGAATGHHRRRSRRRCPAGSMGCPGRRRLGERPPHFPSKTHGLLLGLGGVAGRHVVGDELDRGAHAPRISGPRPCPR